MVPPTSCESLPPPSERAARARVSSAFQLPPSCVDRVSRTDASPEMARRGRRALRGGVATAILVAFLQLGGGNFDVTHLARAARPYLRQQMPRIFGHLPMRLLPPKGNGVIRKRGETLCLPSCAPAAHSREYAVMIWHTRRAEVVAPYEIPRQFTFSRPTRYKAAHRTVKSPPVKRGHPARPVGRHPK